MELKPSYKQTEVGVIPKDWSISCINDLTNLVGDGIHTTPIYSNNGDYFFINGNNLSGGNVVLTEDTKRVDHSEYLKHKKKLDNRTIFISINGTIGNLAFYNNEPVVLGKSAAYLNVKERFSKKYLYYSLQTNAVLQHFEDGLTGTTIKNLGLGTIRNTPIQHPSTKAEQTAIANALSDADALIQSLTSLIAKKRQIKQGAMQTLLNPYENGQLKAGWGFVTYGEVFTFLATASCSRNELSSNGEYGYIHYGDIHTKWDSFVDFKKDFVPAISQTKVRNYVAVNDGDLVMADASEDYAGIGKSVEIKGIGNRKIISGLHTFLLRDKRGIFVDGYKGYIQSSSFVKKQLDRLATGLKVYGVSKANLKVIEIPLPPKNEQTRIATILSDMDAEIAALEAKLAKYRHIKQGMMQNLLTGRIRLVQPDSNSGAAA